VGRGQEKSLPYVLVPPPPTGRAFNLPVDTIGGKDFFPLYQHSLIQNTITINLAILKRFKF
jgi:hypothetical protein